MLFSKRNKVFCIGSGKTGTTSMGAALQSLGFVLGNQARAELLIEQWARRDFRPIIDYCRTAQAFQDVPFSLDYTYVVLDQAYPGSKFILTLRSSAEEWFGSLTRFHTKIVGKNRLPTPEEMKAFPYRAVGWLWQAHRLIYGVDESTVFDQEIYTKNYEAHCAGVLDYFCHRPNDLLVLNLREPGAMDELCAFLGVERKGRQMPHLNVTRPAA